MHLPELQLGTAQWGWNTTDQTAFDLMDAWLKAGKTAIDTASNYPINLHPQDFGRAADLLAMYIQAHGLKTCAITLKTGSLNNLRTPDHDLSPAHLMRQFDVFYKKYGENLKVFMIHWDNRDEEQSVRASFEALLSLHQQTGVHIGISGIKDPELYARINADYGLEFDIQAKHNVFASDLPKYTPLTSGRPVRFWTYGINGGGVKLNGIYAEGSTFLTRGGTPELVLAKTAAIGAKLPVWNTAFVRPPIVTIAHIGLIYSAFNPDVHGILIGPSSVAQLRETLDFYKNFEVFDYSDVYEKLRVLAKNLF